MRKGWTVLVAVASVGTTLVSMLVWFAIALFFHLRFQFGLRLLLVLVVVVAIPCSWLAVEMQKARGQHDTVTAIRKLGGWTGYDDEVNSPGSVVGPRCSARLRTLLWGRFFP